MDIPDRLTAVEQDLAKIKAIVDTLPNRFETIDQQIEYIVSCIETISKCLSILVNIEYWV